MNIIEGGSPNIEIQVVIVAQCEETLKDVYYMKRGIELQLHWCVEVNNHKVVIVLYLIDVSVSSTVKWFRLFHLAELWTDNQYNHQSKLYSRNKESQEELNLIISGSFSTNSSFRTRHCSHPLNLDSSVSKYTRIGRNVIIACWILEYYILLFNILAKTANGQYCIFCDAFFAANAVKDYLKDTSLYH